MTKKILGYSGVIETWIVKTSSRKVPFELLLIKNDRPTKTIARFDTEEKARLACDMFQAGAEITNK